MDEDLAEEFKDATLEMANERLKSAISHIFNVDEFQLDKKELRRFLRINELYNVFCLAIRKSY